MPFNLQDTLLNLLLEPNKDITKKLAEIFFLNRLSLGWEGGNDGPTDLGWEAVLYACWQTVDASEFFNAINNQCEKAKQEIEKQDVRFEDAYENSDSSTKDHSKATQATTIPHKEKNAAENAVARVTRTHPTQKKLSLPHNVPYSFKAKQSSLTRSTARFRKPSATSHKSGRILINRRSPAQTHRYGHLDLTPQAIKPHQTTTSSPQTISPQDCKNFFQRIGISHLKLVAALGRTLLFEESDHDSELTALKFSNRNSLLEAQYQNEAYFKSVYSQTPFAATVPTPIMIVKADTNYGKRPNILSAAVDSLPWETLTENWKLYFISIATDHNLLSLHYDAPLAAVSNVLAPQGKAILLIEYQAKTNSSEVRSPHYCCYFIIDGVIIKANASKRQRGATKELQIICSDADKNFFGEILTPRKQRCEFSEAEFKKFVSACEQSPTVHSAYFSPDSLNKEHVIKVCSDTVNKNFTRVINKIVRAAHLDSKSRFLACANIKSYGGYCYLYRANRSYFQYPFGSNCSQASVHRSLTASASVVAHNLAQHGIVHDQLAEMYHIRYKRRSQGHRADSDGKYYPLIGLYRKDDGFDSDFIGCGTLRNWLEGFIYPNLRVHPFPADNGDVSFVSEHHGAIKMATRHLLNQIASICLVYECILGKATRLYEIEQQIIDDNERHKIWESTSITLEHIYAIFFTQLANIPYEHAAKFVHYAIDWAVYAAQMRTYMGIAYPNVIPHNEKVINHECYPNVKKVVHPARYQKQNVSHTTTSRYNLDLGDEVVAENPIKEGEKLRYILATMKLCLFARRKTDRDFCHYTEHTEPVKLTPCV